MKDFKIALSLVVIAFTAFFSASNVVAGAPNVMDTGLYAQISIENTAKYAEECVKHADSEFTGQYVFAKGLYKKDSPKFGVLVGMKTKSVVGSDWTKYARCMFSLVDGSHDKFYLDLSPNGTKVSMYGATEGEGSIK